jgi:hypothetical protein
MDIGVECGEDQLIGYCLSWGLIDRQPVTLEYKRVLRSRPDFFASLGQATSIGSCHGRIDV